MKSTLVCIVIALVGCGTAKNTAHVKDVATSAETANCDSAPIGTFAFSCTDDERMFGDHATTFELRISNESLVLKNVSAEIAANDFHGESARFAPYVRRSTLPRTACRYQSTGDGQRFYTVNTYKVARALYQGQAGEVTIYDDGGERSNSTILQCKPL